MSTRRKIILAVGARADEMTLTRKTSAPVRATISSGLDTSMWQTLCLIVSPVGGNQ